MKICVCIKPVPASVSVRADEKSGIIKKDGCEFVINPADRNALESALQLKQKHGAQVSVITMAPESAQGLLREAAPLGADSLFLVSDPAFSGSDTYATALTLCAAINLIGGFDIIICGRKSTDGETAQVGPELAAMLKIPVAVNCIGEEFDGKSLTCRRITDGEEQTVRLNLPCLITVRNSSNSLRLPSITGMRRAQSVPLTLITNKHLGIPEEKCGISGSPTRVEKTFIRPIGKRTTEYKSGENALLLIKDALKNGRLS